MRIAALGGLAAAFFCFVAPASAQLLSVSTDVPKAIPDNNLTGIQSSLAVGAPGASIGAIYVKVDITHTYQGDLAIQLVHPDGTVVALHSNVGGSADNVNEVFKVTALAGKPASGAWTLRVQDTVNLDVGTLNAWSLAFVGSVTEVSSTDVPKSIPDNNPTGATSLTTVNLPAQQLAAVYCRVDITHTYIGDLNITLTHPSGPVASLWANQGLGADNLHKTFDVTSQFGALSPNGSWSLSAIDSANIDIGTIDNWTLIFLYAATVELGPPQYASVGDGPTSLAAGDINHDGLLDLVTANTIGSTVSVSFQGPAGFFAPGGTGVPVGGSPRAALTADFTADTFGEIVIVSSNADSATVLQSVGPFFIPTTVLLGAGTSPFDVVAADFNLDGKLDFASANSNTGTITRVFGGGVANTYSPQPQIGAGGSGTIDLSVGDLNLDGAPDLVAANLSGVSIGALLNSGTGAFAPAVSVSTSSPGPSSVEAADMNGDSLLDLVTMNGGIPTIHFGAGATAFGPATTVPTTATGSSCGAVDLNGDGFLDMPIVDPLGTVNVLMGAGGAVFTSGTQILAGGQVSALLAADLNSDGFVDVALAQPIGGGNDRISIALNQTVATRVADFGTGTFGCGGMLGFGSNSIPAVGNGALKFVATNAPPKSLGVCIIADAADIPGSDQLFLNLLLHVNLFASTSIYAFDMPSDRNGTAIVPVPLPSDPLLINALFFGQAIFVEPAACSGALVGLVSTRGGSILIQP